MNGEDQNGYITAEDLEKTYGVMTLNEKARYPVPFPDQVEFTTAGTYSWTVPNNVTSISVLCVGGGGGGTWGTSNNAGGGGGGLGYRNNVAVVPGSVIPVVVGAAGAGGAVGTGATDGGDSYLALVEYIQDFSLSTQGTNFNGLFFKPDGTSFFALDTTNIRVYQYDMTTPWDISSASYIQNLDVSPGGTEAAASGISFSPDGERLFVIGSNLDQIKEFGLTTGWDLSTGSYRNTSNTIGPTTPTSMFFKSDGTKVYILDSGTDNITEAEVKDIVYIGSEEASPSNITFKPDGTKMYIIGTTGDDVNEYDLATAWVVTSARYVQNFSVASQDTSPTAIAFKTDGTVMYVTGGGSASIYQYSLGTAWDVSSATYVQSYTPLNIIDGITFKSDGSQFLAVDAATDKVTSYDLATPWDISTASPGGGGGDATGLTYVSSFSVASQETDPYGLTFKPDGTKMYVCGSTGDDINEYSLSTPFDVTSASYVQNFSITDITIFPSAVQFNSSGTEMYVLDYVSARAFLYNLSVAWDISSATISAKSSSDASNLYLVQELSVSAQDTQPQSVSFSTDGTKMLMLGGVGDDINEYTLSTAWDISSASYVQNFSVTSQEATPLGMYVKSDGTIIYITGNTSDAVHQYDLTTPWDLSTASFTQSFVFTSLFPTSLEPNPSGISFKSDGTVMYISGQSYDLTFGFTLGTAWDISTVNGVVGRPYYVLTDTSRYTGKSLSVSTQETGPQGVAFKSDGTKMYIVGTTGDDINEYDLSTAWDVSTGTFVQASATLAMTNPYDITFKSDGTFVYITHQDFGPGLVSYELTTPWDVSTLKLSTAAWNIEGSLYSGNSFSVATEETLPRGLFFKPDGTKMYVAGPAGDDVNEYSLSTAWDITSATFVASGSVITNVATAAAIFFKPDGTQLYVIDQSSPYNVVEYSLSSAWDITTISYTQAFSVSAEETAPHGLFFKPDGTKMYVIGTTGDDVNEYDLSSAWDVSTASFVQSQSVTTGTNETAPRSVSFNDSGTEMYVWGVTNDCIFVWSLSSAWDVSTATYSGNRTVSFLTQIADGYQFYIKPDGTKLFIVDSTADAVFEYQVADTINYFGDIGYIAGSFMTADGTKVYATGTGVGGIADPVGQYTLSTPYLLSSASFVQYISVSATETTPSSIALNEDGTRFFVLGSGGDRVDQYVMSTPYDVSTAVYEGTSTSLSPETTPNGLAFGKNGEYFYIVGAGSDTVLQYVCLANITYTGTGGADTTPQGIEFNSTGTKFYMVGSGSDFINQWDLSVAWDLTSATFKSKTSSRDSLPTGIFLRADETQFFTTGAGSDVIREFKFGTAAYLGNEAPNPYALTFGDSGSSFYVVKQASPPSVVEYSLGTPYDISTSSYTQSFSVASEEATPTGLAFNSTGTRMLVVGTADDLIEEYSLSTAWDISSATYTSKSFSVAGQDGTPYAMYLNSAGNYLFFVGTTNDSVYQYASTSSLSVAAQTTAPNGLSIDSAGTSLYVSSTTGVIKYGLSSAWDVTTGSYSETLDLTSLSKTIVGVYVKGDGSNLYVPEITTDMVRDYELPTPNDLSTAVLATGEWAAVEITTTGNTLDVSSYETVPVGLYFSPDGLVLSVIGQSADLISNFELSPAWDITSATFTSDFSVTSQQTVPTDMWIGDSGSKLYVVGLTPDAVSEYDMSTPYSLNDVVGYGGARGTTTGGAGGSYRGDGGGNGGNGSQGSSVSGGGGGGAGGYSGNGGNSGTGSSNGQMGSGGGGGGGMTAGSGYPGGAGGGVGIYGEGQSGVAAGYVNVNASTVFVPGGGGGSGGENAYEIGTTDAPQAGNFGGGANGSDTSTQLGNNGGSGAVRIIWGTNRAYPSTNTEDQ